MAKEITIINDHEAQAFDRFLEQWKNKPNMESSIRALVGGYSEIETMFFDLLNKTFDINTAEGAQLDVLGIIVGQPRLNFDDDFYRILLVVRIGINISEGDPERIISTAKILTQASFLHYRNLRGREIEIGTDGIIDLVTKDFLLFNLQKVVMGTVRLNGVVTYEKDEAFAMAGVNAEAAAKGFGDEVDVLAGGKFGKLHVFKSFFSFDGDATGDNGFGSVYDPLVGGVLS